MGIGRNRNSLYHLKSRPFSVGQKEEEKRVFHLEAVVLLYLPLELELCLPERGNIEICL